MVFVMDSAHWTAMGLTFACSLATVIGGLLIFVLDLGLDEKGPKSRAKYNSQLGHSLSFACGVMLYISFSDMLVAAIDEIGFFWANMWLFFGLLLFGVLSRFVPDADEMLLEVAQSSTTPRATPVNSPSAATNGLRQRKRGGDKKTDPAAAANAVPKEDSSSSKQAQLAKAEKKRKGKLYMTGLVAAAAVTLHNLPEGLAVYLAALSVTSASRKKLFLGIFLHNIPEGLAVAMPLYAATGSKWNAVLWATLSGLAEPVGALVMGTVIGPHLSEQAMQGTLAAVAGIMIYISMSELYPTALEYVSGQKACYSCFGGMFVVFMGVHLLHATAGH